VDPILEPFNYPFWGALCLVWAEISYLHIWKVYRCFSLSFWTAFGACELRALLAMGLAVIAGNVLKKTLGRFAELSVHAGFLLLTIVCQFGAIVFALQGLTLPRIWDFLFAKGIGGAWDMLQITGCSGHCLSGFLAGLLVSAVLGVLLLMLSDRSSRRRRWALRLAPLVAFCYLAALLVFLEQAFSGSIKTADAWMQEQTSAPFYVAVLHPRGYATYEAMIDARAATALPFPPITGKRELNIILVVVESLGARFIDPATTPNLYRFQRENFSFAQAFANANATALAWPAILSSVHPIYGQEGFYQPGADTAPAMRAWHKAGVDVSVFAASHLDDFNTRARTFGRGKEWIRMHVPDPALSTPDNDRLAVRRLLDAIRAQGGRGRHLHILMLDSTHAPYYWPPDHTPKFRPFLDTSGRTILTIRSQAEGYDLVRNRYKNALNFLDGLFGDIVAGLKSSRRYAGTAIIVLGDHGQEFGEHGNVTHGSNLFNTQIHIPLIMRLPGIHAAATGRVASQIDIMPTLLDYAGLDPAALPCLCGHSLLRGSGPDIPALSMQYLKDRRQFVLSTGEYKIGFFLSSRAGAKLLDVTKITDRDDRPFIPGAGSLADYRAFLDREFVPALNRTGLITILAPARDRGRAFREPGAAPRPELFH
jgi:hypothetical protein